MTANTAATNTLAEPAMARLAQAYNAATLHAITNSHAPYPANTTQAPEDDRADFMHPDISLIVPGVNAGRRVRSRDGSSAPAHKVHNQDDQEDNNEHIEQDLGDARRCAGDTAETEKSGDEGDDESDECVIQQVTCGHGVLLVANHRTDGGARLVDLSHLKRAYEMNKDSLQAGRRLTN